MDYTEDFSLKCNKNNCNGIAISLHECGDVNYKWSGDIIIKYYNEKEEKRYSSIIDMSIIADKYNIKDKFIYTKLEGYFRYSKNKLINKIQNGWWNKWNNIEIERWLKKYNLIIPYARDTHKIEYKDLKTGRLTTPYTDWSYYQHIEL